MIPFTRSRCASAMSQPNGPDRECVRRMAGRFGREGCPGVMVELLGKCGVLDGLYLRRVELIEDTIADPPTPRPLRVQVRLGPQVEVLRHGEPLLDSFGVAAAERAVDLLTVGRSTTARLVDDVDLEAS